jgi:hypothetical protein
VSRITDLADSLWILLNREVEDDDRISSPDNLIVSYLAFVRKAFMASHGSFSELVFGMSGSSADSSVQLGEDDKYSVVIIMPPKAIPTPKEYSEAIKGAVKGKMLAKMKKEAVDCPVKLKVVSFVECFTCQNYNRRIRGKVGCKGLPLTQGPVKP